LRANKDNREIELSDFPGAMQLRSDFFTAMENDLKTNEALTVLWELLKSDLDADVLYRLIMEFDQVLGLGLAGISEEYLLKSLRQSLNKKIIDVDLAQSLGLEAEGLRLADLPAQVRHLVEERQIARQDKDFAKADEYRAQIKEHGFELLDMENNELLIRKI
jgi:cysteinyl-tRNA synthetase